MQRHTLGRGLIFVLPMTYIGSMKKAIHCLHIEKDDLQTVRATSKWSGLSMNELIRQMVGHCLQPNVFNVAVPVASGQLQIGSRS